MVAREEILKIKKLKQIEKIRNIEKNMAILYEINNNLKKILYKIEIQEEKLLYEVSKQLDVVEKIDAEIETLTYRNETLTIVNSR